MSHDLTCKHCGKPTPTGVCRCGKASADILLRIYKALDEPLACGHDLSNWCDYCETCGECRDAGKGDKTLKAELSRLRAIEKAAQHTVAEWGNPTAIATERGMLLHMGNVIEELRYALAGRSPKAK